jgi:hypothetical protein
MSHQLASLPVSGRNVNRPFLVLKLMLVLGLILSGCNLVKPATQTALPNGVTPTLPAQTQTAGPSDSGGMQVRFVDLTDGGSIPSVLDADGRPLVTVQVEVSGISPVIVTLEANGLPAVDAGGHLLEARNFTSAASSYTGEIPWSPANGGGDYTLVVTAMSSEKQFATATVHVTVTGIAAFTPTPPPLGLAEAQKRISELIRQQFSVSIPKPSVERFDFPTNPTRSRWIGSAYYQGTRYYIDLYDDTHYEWSTGQYSDTAHKGGDKWLLCRPSGTARVLTIFVDYGNIGANRDTVLAQVPVVVDMVNGLYTQFTLSQGFSAALMTVQAEAAYVSPPPAPGEFLTADQVRTLTGKDPAAYDFLMQIDLDANATLAGRYFTDLIGPGGGVALQACDSGGKYGIFNIWSSITDASNVQGGLIMDFDHELSHLFGMMDSWAYRRDAFAPNGITLDDWIPYVMFGWTDTDGDGIPEIIDPTPYGTSGPLP